MARLKEQILGRILRYLEDKEGNPLKGYAIDIIDESIQEYCTFAHILKGITYTNFKKRRLPPKDTIKKILNDGLQGPTPEDLTEDVTATLVEDFEVRSSNVSFTVGQAAYALGLNRLQLERHAAAANVNFRVSRGGDHFLTEKDIDKIAQVLIDREVPIDAPTR